MKNVVLSVLGCAIQPTAPSWTVFRVKISPWALNCYNNGPPLDTFTPDTVLLRPASPRPPRMPPTVPDPRQWKSSGDQSAAWKQLSRSKKNSRDTTFPALGNQDTPWGIDCGEEKASVGRAGKTADRLHLNHDPASCHGAYMTVESRRNTD